MTGERPVDAHRAAVVAAMLGLVGNALGVVAFWRLSAPPLRQVQVLGMAVSAALLAILWLRRASPSVILGNIFFLVVLLPTVAVTWLADEGRAAAGVPWVPYEPNKLAALALAVIAPPGIWIGAAGILLFGGSALIHHLLMPDAVRAYMTSGEPFGIIAYSVFALVLLAFSQRGRALEMELGRARAEKQTLERIARVALSLRDLANTPTQTLELIKHELPAEPPRMAVLIGRMGRALDQLQRLNEILSRYADTVPWDKSRTSFDARAEAEAPLADRPGPPPERGART